jgi:hypothetical protein
MRRAPRRAHSGTEDAIDRGIALMARSKHTPRGVPQSKGLYANYFEVGHTAWEFVLDFGETYTGKESSPCHTRIVTTPLYARALLETLQKAMQQYDAAFRPKGD